MKKSMLALLLVITISCDGGNKSGKDDRSFENSFKENVSIGTELDPVLAKVDMRIEGSSHYEVSRETNQIQEVRYHTQDLKELIDRETLSISLKIESIDVPSGFEIKQMMISISDRIENGFYRSFTLDNSYQFLDLEIKGKKDIYNFLGRKKYVALEGVIIRDIAGNEKVFQMSLKESFRNINCHTGYYKAQVSKDNELCNDLKVSGVMTIYENEAEVMHYRSNVVLLNHYEDTLNGRNIQNRTKVNALKSEYVFKGMKRKTKSSFQVNSVREVEEVNLESEIKFYDVGVSEYVINGRSLNVDNFDQSIQFVKYNYYFDNGNMIAMDNFLKTERYFSKKSAELELLIFE